MKICATLICLLGWSSIGWAQTPPSWSDPTLPVRDGLQLWLDASGQNRARQTLGLPLLGAGDPMDGWFDASGQNRHLSQRLPGARPRFHQSGPVALVRFDGADDSLAAANLKQSCTNATVFLLAAPRSNAGLFRGFFAINETGRNDYTSGLTIDLGGSGSARFETLNPEGTGFGGWVDVMNDAFDFGPFHVITVLCGIGPGGINLFVDGQGQAARNRVPSRLRMDEVTVGARCYSNTPEPPHTQGFLDGDIAEVLFYDRLLSEAERRQVEQYLSAKMPSLNALAARTDRANHRFPTVTNPPPVQVFVPGFSVRQLPLDLSNINNLRYRPDGKLLALGYNGHLHLLTDTDGDGLEDKAEFFWDRQTVRGPIGMALTLPDYALGQGVFVAAKGKLALILDTNRDDRADQEIVVAEGWRELPHGVDALGVALDHAGNVYFGLGTADFTDAYLVDKSTGRSRYDLKSERGTILKVSPDFKRREIVCTGIRFPVALAFNGAGDLFCTDQEGATWLPNGNPFDELLHIQPGRHYGFPPRHPRHLPNVIDEPSVFDYTPQHQSTCGLSFNLGTGRSAVFGPPQWTGDAFVAGYSRGKLYRTQLVKTSAGYVARNQLIAALNMLTVDTCVSLRGDLVVATHSGPPDWGSGPSGSGKLYQVRYTDRAVPQPVLAWAASPTETHVAYDRPLEVGSLKNLAQQATMAGGPYVSVGDRFESLRPGYQTVKDQLAAPREEWPVLGASVSPDRRTLILTTPTRRAAVNYAVTLPTTNQRKATSIRELPQHAAVDLSFDLTGVEALWRARDAATNWTGWWPHLDVTAVRAFTAGSREHEVLWPRLRDPGTLTLRAQLDLRQMLRPAVQPGAKIDYEWPAETVTVTFKSAGPLSLKSTASVSNSQTEATLTLTSKENQLVPIELELATGGAAPDLQVSWHTAEDERPRALPLRRILMPWAVLDTELSPPAADRRIPELAGGNWLRGRRLFFGEQAGCSKCHQLRGQGGRLGPDLSNLIYRDYASVLKDIREPNAVLNPDHLGYQVELTDGEVLSGVLVADAADRIELGDSSGKPVTVPRARIKSIQPSAVSIMPEGLDAALGVEGLRDLLTFLLTSPLDPAPIEASGPPPPRPQAEVQAVLRYAETPVRADKPLRVLLVAGPKDHGPGEHDYPLWQKRWATLLALAENVVVTTAMGWPAPVLMQANDVLVFYSNNPGWSAERARELDAYQERGGGLVLLHYAVDGHRHVEALSERIGLAWRGGQSRFRHGPLELQLADASHPILRGLHKLNFVDESYWNLVGDPTRIHLLATGVEEGAAQPLLWTFTKGRGRVFVSILGHYNWTFDDPLFRLVVLRAITWAARQPEDRLAELATIGARLGD